MRFIRSRKHTVSRTLGVLAVAAMAAPLAYAKDDKPATPVEQAAKPPQDKVTITGSGIYQAESLSTKSTADLVDTPQTLSIINDQIIREQSASTLAEALRNSAGVGTFFLGENGNTTTGDAIYMRGSDASGNIFVDGVRDVASISRDTFNIEQIEVLKGAAGADVGRGAATGAVNVVTKRPNLKNGYAATLAAGDGDYLRAAGDGNWRIDTNTAFRLNVMAQDSGVVGRDLIKNKRWGFAPTLGFGIGQQTSAYVSFTHIDQDNTPDGGVFTIGLPGYSTPAPARAFLNTAQPVRSRNFYGTKDDHDEVQADMASLIVEHEFSDNISLTNVTRWGQTDQEYQLSSFTASTANFVTPSAANPAGWTIVRNINNRNATNIVLTNQTNLRATFDTGPVSHTISTGVELIRETQKTRAYVVAGAYPPVSVYHPNPNVGGYTRTLSRAYTKGATDTTAAYFNDTMTFTPQWLATLGLRLDKYETDFDSIAATGVITHFKAEDDLVSGKAGLTFKPTKDSSIYASYAITKQPPGGANFTLTAANTANVNNPNVEPQEAKTYEVGTKWNFLGNRLAVTGALYRTEYSDAVTLDTDGTYYRSGEKSIEGVELGVLGQITPSWNISAGYTVMDTKVKNQAAITADGSTDLTYSPTDSFTAWTTYDFGNGFTIGGGARYNGEVKRGTDGAIGTPMVVDAYTVVDAVVKYRLTKTAELQLNIYNLLDEDYVASINKSGYRYTPGVERSARVTLNFSF